MTLAESDILHSLSERRPPINLALPRESKDSNIKTAFLEQQ